MARAPLGLPRLNRLRRPAEFERLRRTQIKTRDTCFLINANRYDGIPRLGIAVSRRVSTKAVTRNRIKRQVRESFRVHKSLLHGLEIVVVAQAAASNATNAVLAASLKNHWNRLVSACSKLSQE